MSMFGLTSNDTVRGYKKSALRIRDFAELSGLTAPSEEPAVAFSGVSVVAHREAAVRPDLGLDMVGAVARLNDQLLDPGKESLVAGAVNRVPPHPSLELHDTTGKLAVVEEPVSKHYLVARVDVCYSLVNPVLHTHITPPLIISPFVLPAKVDEQLAFT
jgi:hypothetical protein